MSPLRARSLVLLAVVAAVLAWLGLGALDQEGVSPPLPWTAPVVLLVLAVTVLVVGWPVRRWQRGNRERRLDALRAARTAVLAQAASATGAASIGVYAGMALVLLPTVSIEARRADLWRALVALVVAVVLLVAGTVAQRWCRLPDDDDDPRGPGGSEHASSAPAPRDPSHSHAQPPGSRGHHGSR